jgi:tRNA(fMet)-specific endonuclease VapC
MITYLPDTDVLINALNGKRGHKERLSRLVLEGNRLACCAITEAEVHSGIHPQDTSKVEQFLKTFYWYNLTRSVALRAGSWRYQYARQGITLSLPDMLIAATALEYGLILITDNRKHFSMPELKIYVENGS